MMKTLTTLLILAASPLAAQGLEYSNDATMQCLDGASDMAGRTACIGASARACIEQTEGGSSSAAMAGCYEREGKYWDDRLNASYGEAKDFAKTFDADNGGSDALSKSLVAMQRAWIPFRDKACSFEAAQWGGGTGANSAFTACLMTLTGEQTLRIESAMQEK